jgi:putative flavoprotein involved in K+ transport
VEFVRNGYDGSINWLLEAVMKKTNVLVIGAGQAGLAMGYHLQKTSLRFLLVDGCSRVGDSWRRRYDSLTLFTPRSLSALPGLALKGDPQGYASRDEFADYLETYARHFDFPIKMNAGIQNLKRVNGHFSATSFNGQEIEAQVVVLANGGFQKPVVPTMSKNLSGDVQQFSAESYRNPSQIPAGTVVVVGDGATGRDIAVELSAPHTVYLAAGKPRRLMPERILGMSMWWWLNTLGFLTAPTDSFIGRKMRAMDSFPNRERDFAALRRKGIRIMPKVTQADGNAVTLENGASVPVNAVVWAMGYCDDSDWVAIPEVKDTQGNFVHRKGISPVKNLYFIGRPWQTSRASAIISGVDRDAALIANAIQSNTSFDVTRIRFPADAPSI